MRALPQRIGITTSVLLLIGVCIGGAAATVSAQLNFRGGGLGRNGGLGTNFRPPVPRCGPGSPSGARCGGTSGPMQQPVPAPNTMWSPFAIQQLQQAYFLSMYQFQVAQYMQWLQLQQRMAAAQQQMRANQNRRPNNAQPPVNRPNPPANPNPNPNPPVNPPPNNGNPPPAAPQQRWCCNPESFAASALVGGVFMPNSMQCRQFDANRGDNQTACNGPLYITAPGEAVPAIDRCNNACRPLVGWCVGHPTYVGNPARPRLFSSDECIRYGTDQLGGPELVELLNLVPSVMWMSIDDFPTYQSALDYINLVSMNPNCGNGVVDEDEGEECDMGVWNGRGYGCELDCSLDSRMCQQCANIRDMTQCTTPCTTTAGVCAPLPACANQRQFYEDDWGPNPQPPLEEQPVGNCGNGIRDVGEACDCGVNRATNALAVPNTPECEGTFNGEGTYCTQQCQLVNPPPLQPAPPQPPPAPVLPECLSASNAACTTVGERMSCRSGQSSRVETCCGSPARWTNARACTYECRDSATARCSAVAYPVMDRVQACLTREEQTCEERRGTFRSSCDETNERAPYDFFAGGAQCTYTRWCTWQCYDFSPPPAPVAANVIPACPSESITRNCSVANGRMQCMRNGTTITNTCCPGNQNRLEWQSYMPDCNDNCEGSATDMYTSHATSGAQRKVDLCLANARVACSERAGTYAEETGSDCRTRTTGSLQKTVTITCGWACARAGGNAGTTSLTPTAPGQNLPACPSIGVNPSCGAVDTQLTCTDGGSTVTETCCSVRGGLVWARGRTCTQQCIESDWGFTINRAFENARAKTPECLDRQRERCESNGGTFSQPIECQRTRYDNLQTVFNASVSCPWRCEPRNP